MLLALRIITLSLAVFGAIISVIGFFALRAEMVNKKEEIAIQRALVQAIRDEAAKDPKLDKGKLADLERALRDSEGVIQAVPYLLVAAIMALIGGVLVMCGWTACGSVWLLFSFLGPVILNPRSIVCTFFIPLAALVGTIACFVPRPAPSIRQASDRRRDDYDDYDDRDYDDRRDRRDRRRDD